MQTLLELKQEIRPILWPAGEARRLQPAHDRFFIRALIDLQRWVPCLQQFNTSQFGFCSTYWENAKTVIDRPIGVVRRIYTLASADWRDKVYYHSGTFDEIEFWANNLYQATTPINTGLAKLPMGYRQAEAAADSTIGRARTGIWTINRDRLYVAPWIQSNETLVVEWDGIKTDWLDTDTLNEDIWTEEVKMAIGMYVKWQHEFHYGTDRVERLDCKASYDAALSDLIWQCREETRQRETVDLGSPRIPLQSEITDDAVPSVSAEAVAWDAFIGDWGVDGQPLIDVVALIESYTPKNVFTLGDNIYGASGVPAPDEIWGKFWSRRIFPYTGVYTPGEKQTIWATWGNHDWDYGLSLETDFLPGLKNNRRYYSIVSGAVQYFIIDTDPREPDGGYVDANTSTENSIMGQWLRVSLAMSTAKWKVVIGHHGPYTSDVNNTPGAAWMRWPFAAWGADMTLWGHSHNYEEFVVDGIPYIVNGLGGNTVRDFNGQVVGSQFQYNLNYGAGFIEATCDTLTFRFITRNGTLIRTVVITDTALEFNTFDEASGGLITDDSATPPSVTEMDALLLEAAAAGAFQMTAPNRDSEDVVLSSPVVWVGAGYGGPSGGTYTLLVRNDEFIDVDSWKVTYDARGKTITQPPVTRNADGKIIVQPALVLS